MGRGHISMPKIQQVRILGIKQIKSFMRKKIDKKIAEFTPQINLKYNNLLNT